MSTPEFFGMFLSLALVISTIVFMMVAYESAVKRHFRQMLTFLRLAGFLSIASWLVMTAVIVKYNKDYTVLQQAKAFEAEPETRIVGQGISERQAFAVKTAEGLSFTWSVGDGVRSGRRGSVYSGRSGGSGFCSDGSSDGSLQLSRDTADASGHGGSRMSQPKPDDEIRI